jgi:trans-aconitate 2-methyltransferase
MAKEMSLGSADRERIARFIRDRITSRDNPRELGEALVGPFSGRWKYRVGDFRVIASIEDKTISIVIVHGGQPPRSVSMNNAAAAKNPDWSAAQYLKFEDERTRPARDLLAQVPVEKPRRVVDIGCGPGNSTELLAGRWPRAQISGFDTSPDMLEKARARLPGVAFDLADAADWAPPEPVDVIFANAVFQWLPEHPAVLRRLMRHLAPGGALAVQMPDNLSEPSHRLMRETAAEMRFSTKLASAAREPLPPVSFYYDLLTPLSGKVDIWHTLYNHPLTDAAAIVEWVKSTGLKPFLDPLDGDEKREFLAVYAAKIAKAYPPAADGRVLLRFPRLFIVARRES